MRNSSGTLIIQPDWSVALREANPKIWISYKKTGSETVHGEIKGTLPYGGGEQHFQCSDGFSVEQAESKRVTIKYMTAEQYCLTTFQTPAVNFSTIHPARKSVLSLDVSPDGLGVSADSQGSLFVWETNSGEVRRKLEGHVGDVYCCRLFPSGIVVLSGGSDMMIKIWSAETGKCAATFIGHRAPITDFAVVDRGRNIFSCSKDGTVKLWDCGTKQCILTLDQLQLGTVNACALAEASDVINLGELAANRSDREVGTEGKVIAIAGEIGKLAVHSIQSRESVFRVSCDSAVNCCCFIDSTQLACGTQDGQLYYWDIRHTGNPLKVMSDRSTAILSMCTSQNGLLTSTADGSCVSIKNNYAVGVEYSGSDCEPLYRVVQDEKFIYTACRDGIIRKYSL